jgi:hypothetical protein
MLSVSEITSALPGLSDQELRQVERALINLYRQRKPGLIFDDAYGTFTEEDQAALVDEAFAAMDRAEQRQEPKRKPR